MSKEKPQISQIKKENLSNLRNLWLIQHGTDHFAGREQEVQDLMMFARKGLAGEASVAFVTGEAGMGKTALVEEVFRRLKAENARVSHGSWAV